jgi:hypothetical protein
MWLSSDDRNLVAQLETVLAMPPSELGEEGGVDIRVGDDLVGDRAPGIVDAKKERLNSPLGEAVNEGK